MEMEESQLLYQLSIGIVLFGVVVYIPSTIIAAREGLWNVFLINTLIYLIALFIVHNKMRANTKAFIIIGMFHLLGVAL